MFTVIEIDTPYPDPQQLYVALSCERKYMCCIFYLQEKDISLQWWTITRGTVFILTSPEKTFRAENEIFFLLFIHVWLLRVLNSTKE